MADYYLNFIDSLHNHQFNRCAAYTKEEAEEQGRSEAERKGFASRVNRWMKIFEKRIKEGKEAWIPEVELIVYRIDEDKKNFAWIGDGQGRSRAIHEINKRLLGYDCDTDDLLKIPVREVRLKTFAEMQSRIAEINRNAVPWKNHDTMFSLHESSKDESVKKVAGIVRMVQEMSTLSPDRIFCRMFGQGAVKRDAKVHNVNDIRPYSIKYMKWLGKIIPDLEEAGWTARSLAKLRSEACQRAMYDATLYQIVLQQDITDSQLKTFMEKAMALLYKDLIKMNVRTQSRLSEPEFSKLHFNLVLAESSVDKFQKIFADSIIAKQYFH
jgi:hypothetical protein